MQRKDYKSGGSDTVDWMIASVKRQEQAKGGQERMERRGWHWQVGKEMVADKNGYSPSLSVFCWWF
jgi:hypothetical protein